MKRISVVGLAAGLLAMAAASQGWAGSPYTVSPQYPSRAIDPTASGVPNVPDLHGCVKWCWHDLNPCDPPIFKRADGRCAFPD